MEKQKHWHFYLIITVIILTLINILPTIFYYTKPLQSPINEARAKNIAHEIIHRVNSLEDESASWLWAYSKLLDIRPIEIQLKKDDPGLFEIQLKNDHDTERFKRFFPAAGALIPFVPAQLSLFPSSPDKHLVLVRRQISVHLQPNEIDQLFKFTSLEVDGKISSLYQKLTYDRVAALALALAGESSASKQLQAIANHPTDPRYDEYVFDLSRQLLEYAESAGEQSASAKRYFASWTQTASPNRDSLVQGFMARADAIIKQIDGKLQGMHKEQKNSSTPLSAQDPIKLFESQKRTLEKATALVRKNTAIFNAGMKPFTHDKIVSELRRASNDTIQEEISLKDYNPFIASIQINWVGNGIELLLYPDLKNTQEPKAKSEAESFKKERIDQLLINEMARLSRVTGEKIIPQDSHYQIGLNQLSSTQSLLAFDLGYLATKESRQLAAQIAENWHPQHQDLQSSLYPIVEESLAQKDSSMNPLALVVYTPSASDLPPPLGIRDDSIYVIARGFDSIMQKYRDNPTSPERAQAEQDMQRLQTILQQRGFISYPGNSFGFAPEFQNDLIFELHDYYLMLLNATQEHFIVYGSQRYAQLEFTDVAQRILTTNKIDDQAQENLVRWKEEYSAAQVDIDPTKRYEIPAPTKNIYWENFKLTFLKYFRGDERKILKWGLDLSGGKTVRIGLLDQNNRPVTNSDDLNQAVNELYTRINKLGVSERTIRIENNGIVLDFPGSQALSAEELVKASAMSFHIVNEKFSPYNASLKDAVDQFLQNIWNEAVVTNRKDSQSVNEIAWRHLGGDSQTGQLNHPRAPAAETLFENGLRLANVHLNSASSTFDDTLSRVAVMRGDEFTEWNGQTHPLVIIFNNYALEGASLTNIQVGFDPNEGNLLSFSVKGSYQGSRAAQGGSPREDFYAWSSQFSEDKIAGTPKELYSHGKGWRMAVILNGTIITQPVLRAALREGGTISGRFSQREISQLAADLKAGSLSFTPRILSEQNVSPELGREERAKGIAAAFIGLILVAAIMIGYYRFGGFVATCAVFFNLLIMWGILQNIGAAITLPGIAAIVLTIGMAVDANVLVFERIREEFRISHRLSSAIQAGYNKAFSAIIDSNITTVIAALILIRFDSGPIKGFAVMLIIGIISSMFTALFITRYFFGWWIKGSKERKLTMSEWIKNSKFDFLKHAKISIPLSILTVILSGYLFVSQHKTLLGMDFTGGYSLQLELQEKPGTVSYRQMVAEALVKAGAAPIDVNVRELSRPNYLRIQLGMGMEEKGHPFFQMEQKEAGNFTYGYEANPRLNWVVHSLKESGLSIPENALKSINDNWSMMSGQLSKTMYQQALMGLGLAFLSILVYITFRFEFKYAVGSTVALFLDVAATLGILALFHRMGFTVQINLEAVGAIMTIIGYSLNDKIIVFDRVREDVKLLRKMSFPDIVNHALNITLSRTLMTSGTTLAALFALVAFGGQSIFGFSLIMTIGVIVGTLSSLFVAAPVMLYVHNREQGHPAAAIVQR